MNDGDRVAVGRSVYARNIGVSEEEAEELMVRRAGRTYTTEAFSVAGGLGWSTDQLTDRDRAIAVIAALVAQHVTDERLATYLNLARNSGVTEEGLTALMILLTAYIGQPAASAAMATVQRTAVSTGRSS